MFQYNNTVKIAATLLALVVISSTAFAGVPAQINEIRISEPGTDENNFWELALDPSNGPGALNNVSLITVSGEFEPGLIEFAYDLSSFANPADNFFLGHQMDMSAELVTGDDYFGSPTNFLLVTGFTGMAGDDIDADNDGTPEVEPWSSVWDGVFLFDGDANPDFAYGSAVPVGPDGTFTPAHVYRENDMFSDWVIGDFGDLGNDTPGVSNVPEPAGLIMLMISCFGLSLIRRK